MPRRIEDEVSRNRRDTARAFAADRQPATRTERVLQVPPLPVEVEATVEIYTRPVNDSMLVGHPEQSNGQAVGIVGDNRGAWTQQTSTTTALTQDGRRSLAESLVGEDVIVDRADVGDAVTDAFDLDDGSGTTRIRSSFRFGESPASVTDGTITDSDGRDVVTASVSSVAASVGKEVRLDVSLAYTANTGSEAAVTDLDTVSNSLRRTSDDQLEDVAIGTDDTQPSQSDTSLGNQVIRKTGRRSTIGSRAQTQTVIGRGEPATQPHDIRELAVFSQAGTMVLRVTFGSERKDDRIRLRAGSGIDIR